jgi:hypothetical protein
VTDDERSRLEAKLEALRRELDERRASVPAHTIRPHQLLILEELEEKIADLCVKLGAEG